MQIDYALILSAGLGTRMGPIGKSVPKVLWPIFEKNLLELQIAYVNSLGIRNIYVNTHYLAELVHSQIKRMKLPTGMKIQISHEVELLDIGGGVHQVASRPEINYTGNLFVFNCDQVLYLKKSKILEMQNLLGENSPVVLASILVDPLMGYSGIDKKNDFMTQILSNQEILSKNMKQMETYAGVGLIHLPSLKPISGRTKFFESVAPFEKISVKIFEIFQEEYWDFGTVERYIYSMKKLLELYRRQTFEESSFLNFLIKNKFLNKEKIHETSYGTKTSGIIRCQNIEIWGDELKEIIAQKKIKKSASSVLISEERA